jgi:hypothetical protein
MPPSKETRLRVAQRRAKVAELRLQGISNQFELARRLGLAPVSGQKTITKDLKNIEEDCKRSAIRDFDASTGKALAKLEMLEAKLWRDYELSRVKKRKLKDGTTETVEVPGNPRIAARIRSVIQARCELLELLARPGETSTSPPIIGFRIHVTKQPRPYQGQKSS